VSRAAVVLLLVVCAALAGCAHAPAAPALSRATGPLHGIVVDTGIRPLAGVRLSAQGPQGAVAANTSAMGTFAFPPLPLGAYVVTAHRAGFLDARTTAQVDGADRALHIQLAPDPRTAPYVVASVFRGFVECSTTTLVLTAIPNLPGDLVAQATCGAGPAPCTRPSNVTRDNDGTSIPVDGFPLWVQHETVWQATQSLGEQLHLFVSALQGGASATSTSLNDTAGPSPLLTVLNTTALAAAKVGPGTLLQLTVFAGGMKDSGSQVCTPQVNPVLSYSCLWDSGATTEQEFTIYTHLFYGFTPPPGYRFTADGDPVPPPSS
jgi:hypothetical protein